jgi:hypothetical protein
MLSSVPTWGTQHERLIVSPCEIIKICWSLVFGKSRERPLDATIVISTGRGLQGPWWATWSLRWCSAQALVTWFVTWCYWRHPILLLCKGGLSVVCNIGAWNSMSFRCLWCTVSRVQPQQCQLWLWTTTIPTTVPAWAHFLALSVPEALDNSYASLRERASEAAETAQLDYWMPKPVYAFLPRK